MGTGGVTEVVFVARAERQITPLSHDVQFRHGCTEILIFVASRRDGK